MTIIEIIGSIIIAIAALLLYSWAKGGIYKKPK